MHSKDTGDSRDAEALEVDSQRVPPRIDDLGRRWRTYRQRRKSPAPALLALIAIGVGLALWADGGMLVVVIKAWAVLIPLAVVGGIAGNYFAPMPDGHERLRLTVYDYGVVIRTDTGAESIVKPARLTAGWGKTIQRGALDLALEWKTKSGRVIKVKLDSFGSSTSLRRALVDREFEPYPLRKRIGFGSAGAAALAALIAWAFTLDPFPLPEEDEDLELFCTDPSMTFGQSPQYEGEGPHPLQVWTDFGSHYEVSEMMAEQGWSANPGETVLIACGEDDPVEKVADCEYTDNPAGVGEVAQVVPAYLVDYHFAVFEAATHRRVGEVTVEAEKPEGWTCPEYIYIYEGKQKDRINVLPQSEAVAEALIPFVERPADA